MAAPIRSKRFEGLVAGAALLLVIAILFTLQSPDNKRDVPGNANTQRFPLQIAQIQLRVMESSLVQGITPDACSTVCEPEVSRSGNTITIQIFGERPRDRACAQVVLGVSAEHPARRAPAGRLRPARQQCDRRLSHRLTAAFWQPFCL
jgi:hypothetical protein